MSDIPKDNLTKIALFADDTAIYRTGGNVNDITLRLQRHMDKITDWMEKWKIQINPNKTQAIVFTKSRQRPDTNIRINNQDIPWLNDVKYLGLKFDKKLVWNAQLLAITIKAKRLVQVYNSFLNRKSKLSTENKITIYKVCIRPALLYAVQTWINLCKTGKKKIQTFQNKILRIIANAPWFVRNLDLHRDLQIESIEEFMQKLTDDHLAKTRTNPNELIRLTHAVAQIQIAQKKK